MDNRDLAIEFTETHYSSKNQVMEYYGNSYRDLMWTEICKYRLRFSRIIKLECDSNSNIFYVSHNKLNEKLELLTRKTLHLSTLFGETQYDSSFFYKHKKYFSHVVFEEVFSLLKSYKIDISLHTLVKLVSGEQKASNTEKTFSRNLFLLFYRIGFQKKESEKLTIKSLEKISRRLGNKHLIRKESWFLDEANLIVAGFETNVIEERMKKLLNFIYQKKSDIHPLIKAISVFYYFKYGIMTDKNVDLLAVFLMLQTLKVSNYKGLVLTIPLIKGIVEQGRLFDDAYWSSTESNNDITYLIHIFIDIATKKLDTIIKSFENNDEVVKRFKEFSEEKKSLKAPIKTSYMGRDKSIKEIRNLGLHKKEQLFLEVAKDQTKKTYTLSDFQEVTNSSYEKARYSMNNFCKEGLFSKKQVGKKFVFFIHRENF